MNLKMNQVVKQFDGFKLGPIDLNLLSGQTAAILGPNGAGKSTLFQIMTANLRVDAGTAHLGDQLIAPENFNCRKQVAYQSQQNELPHWVNAKEVLSYVAFLHGKEEKFVSYFSETFDLIPFYSKPLRSCSYGMLKRVSLAIAFLQESPLLILDEPFSGLDLYHVRSLEQEIVKRKTQRLSTLISTHDFTFVSKHAERCFFIEAGVMSESLEWPTVPQDGRTKLIESRFFKK